MSPAFFRLFGWTLWGAIRSHPARWGLAVLSIAVGVALAYAVELIHSSALNSFTSAVRQFSGVADVTLKSRTGSLDDTAFETVLAMPQVARASPVLEKKVALSALKTPVTWIGLDLFRAARITPALLPKVDEPSASGAENTLSGEALSPLSDQAVFISPALKAQLEASGTPVRRLCALVKEHPRCWTIAGTVPGAPSGQALVVSDLGAMQWRLDMLGQLSRIDIQLKEGVSVSEFMRSSSVATPAYLDRPEEAGSRGASVSRAYRVNLSILALVALLTGGFLVFSTQLLSVAQRRPQWMLLKSMGASSNTVLGLIVAEAWVMGMVGAVLGLAAGIGIAHLALLRLGADLGAGYFQGAQARLHLDPFTLCLYGAVGLGCALLGAWWPAREASQMTGSMGMRKGMAEAVLAQQLPKRWPLLLLGLSPIAACAPPLAGLPVGGYAAIALGLAGGIGGMPWMARAVFRPWAGPLKNPAILRLRLRFASGQLALILAGMVASFSLVVAMAIMVTSFRTSLDVWLESVLPAPLYMRLQGGESAYLTDDLMRRLQALPALEKSEFWATQSVVMDQARPPVVIVARPLNTDHPGDRLPMVQSPPVSVAPGRLPMYASEAMLDLYGWKPGMQVSLPNPRGGELAGTVAGIWRDYARQYGAVAIPLAAYENAVGRVPLTDAAFWPKAGYTADALVQQARAITDLTPLATHIEFAQPGTIRSLSLGIFDRSFAITYLLEAVAIGIGLVGVAATVSATARQRQFEFATLAALGAQRSWVLRLVCAENALIALMGCIAGLVLGIGFAWVLIFVVNPQSFHWSMDMHWPVKTLILLSTGLVLTTTATGTWATVRVWRQSPMALLKSDWN